MIGEAQKVVITIAIPQSDHFEVIVTVAPERVRVQITFEPLPVSIFGKHVGFDIRNGGILRCLIQQQDSDSQDTEPAQHAARLFHDELSRMCLHVEQVS